MIDVSFELFPPVAPEARSHLLSVAQELADLRPSFMSVTYGAGGSNRERTLRTVADLSRHVDVPIAGHLTTIGASRAETHDVLDSYRSLGVSHIVALRGDPPADRPTGAGPDGYADAAALVAAIRARDDGADFRISVAAYPETHPRAASPTADLDNLKRKLAAGADLAITQFFFDPDTFLRFRDRATAAGIEAPIVPGIMPISNFKSIANFARRCGTSIPSWLSNLFEGLEDDPEVHQLVAATIAAEQCQRLLTHGVTGFHFYTMNRRHLSAATVRTLNATPLLAAGSGRP